MNKFKHDCNDCQFLKDVEHPNADVNGMRGQAYYCRFEGRDLLTVRYGHGTEDKVTVMVHDQRWCVPSPDERTVMRWTWALQDAHSLAYVRGLINTK